MALKEDDVTKMLAAGTHLGAENVNFQMEQYVYKKRVDGKYLSCICFKQFRFVSVLLNIHTFSRMQVLA